MGTKPNSFRDKRPVTPLISDGQATKSLLPAPGGEEVRKETVEVWLKIYKSQHTFSPVSGANTSCTTVQPQRVTWPTLPSLRSHCTKKWHDGGRTPLLASVKIKFNITQRCREYFCPVCDWKILLYYTWWQFLTETVFFWVNCYFSAFVSAFTTCLQQPVYFFLFSVSLLSCQCLFSHFSLWSWIMYVRSNEVALLNIHNGNSKH